MRRGDICWYSFAAPGKRRPVLVLTRNSAIPVLNRVTVAPITSTIRDIPTEVVLAEADGMAHACAVNFDNVQTVSKTKVGERITHLSARKMQDGAKAMAFALGFDEA
ncbi:MAG: type II toxin-antitoxin system PemK/MazF family toxin [Gammaproteobacteria bacterium]|nr:type II toxin-antitoxin system PemK/MazF family toxin [Gammaproteobacteria bacterium]